VAIRRVSSEVDFITWPRLKYIIQAGESSTYDFVAPLFAVFSPYVFFFFFSTLDPAKVIVVFQDPLDPSLLFSLEQFL